jgi:hypothetical protein
MKACRKKMATVEVPCPHCELPFVQAELAKHMQVCKVARKERKRQGTGKGAKNSLMGAESLHPGAREIAQERMEMPTEGGRIRCAFCSRQFSSDRIGIHQRICKNLKGARSGQRPARVYDSQAKRMEALSDDAGGSFGSAGSRFGGQKKQRPAVRKQASGGKTEAANKWRVKHQEFQKMLRGAKNFKPGTKGAAAAK